MVSSFGPSSFSLTLGRSSEWLPVGKRILNPAPSEVSVCGLGKRLGLARHDVVAKNEAVSPIGLQLCLLACRLSRFRESL